LFQQLQRLLRCRLQVELPAGFLLCPQLLLAGLQVPVPQVLLTKGAS
jgi:hypothetical protein